MFYSGSVMAAQRFEGCEEQTRDQVDINVGRSAIVWLYQAADSLDILLKRKASLNSVFVGFQNGGIA